MPDENREPETAEQRERWSALHELEDWLEIPMLVLGLAWLVLLVLELVRGGSPLFNVLGTIIWVLFVIDFLVRFFLAPVKTRYLWQNALTAVSLLVPALRVFRAARAFRILRLARTARGLRFVRLLTSFRRGMGALGTAMQRRGFGYVLALTLLVTFLGAAGMYTFENSVPGVSGFASYLDALWWTAMLLTSIASEYWPHTAEGRLLTLLLSMYGFAVFGYITATLASFFVGQDVQSSQSAAVAKQVSAALQDDLAGLREEMTRLREELSRGRPHEADPA